MLASAASRSAKPRKTEERRLFVDENHSSLYFRPECRCLSVPAVLQVLSPDAPRFVATTKKSRRDQSATVNFQASRQLTPTSRTRIRIVARTCFDSRPLATLCLTYGIECPPIGVCFLFLEPRINIDRHRSRNPEIWDFCEHS